MTNRPHLPSTSKQLPVRRAGSSASRSANHGAPHQSPTSCGNVSEGPRYVGVDLAWLCLAKNEHTRRSRYEWEVDALPNMCPTFGISDTNCPRADRIVRAVSPSSHFTHQWGSYFEAHLAVQGIVAVGNEIGSHLELSHLWGTW